MPSDIHSPRLESRRLVAFGLGLLLIFLLPAYAASQVTAGNWSFAHYDNERTGFNPDEVVLSPSNVDKLVERWSFAACGGAVDPPVVANGVAYLVADCKAGGNTFIFTLFAISAATGKLLWQSPLGVSHANCEASFPPAVSGDVVYAGSCYGVTAIDARTGARLWQNTGLGPVVSNPLYANGAAVDNGMLYFTAANGNVYALYTSNGLLDWNFASPYGIAGAPAVAGGFAYVSAVNGVVYALVAEIGAVLWTSARTPSYEVGGSPSVGNGMVYVSGLFGGITALDTNTGAVLWNNLGSVNVEGTPSLAYGLAYIAVEDEDNGPRTAYALNAETGNIVWQVPNIGSWFAVAIANGVVYAVNDGDKKIYALNAMTGGVLATFGNGNVNSTPVVVNGTVYFTGFDGALYAYGI